MARRGARAMDSPELNPPALAVFGAAALASLVVLFRLFEKHIAGEPLLAFEPRRAVPWNVLAPLLIFAPALMNFGVALIAEPPVEFLPESIAAAATAAATGAAAAFPAMHAAARGAAVLLDLAEQTRAAEAATPMILLSAVALLGMVALGVLVLAKAFGADARDLGLPTSWPQLRRDVRIGAAAFAASLVPIYGLMYVLAAMVEPTEGHPLIEQYVAHPSLGMMVAAAFAAAIAAPIAEEISFRVVLQGWLERLATERRGAPPSFVADDAVGERATAGDQPPPGWWPVVASSVVFGLAHWGHGIAPIPLIILGAILGYVYQRTHRLAPGVVCHMLFNGLTLLMMWLQYGT